MNADLQLLQAWSRGDEVAGKTLVGRYYKRVYGFVRSKVEGRPRDLVQRTFLICLERHERYDPQASFAAFLLGIARNVIFEHFRALQKQQRFDPMTTAVRDLAPSPSAIVVDREEHRLLLAALRSVPLDVQIVLELFYWEGLPLDEIARIQGVAVGTAKSRLHRARELLREVMEQSGADEAVRRATLQSFEHWARGLQAFVQADDEPGSR